MKLFVNRPSPYGRNVLVVMHEKGLTDAIQIIPVDPWADPPELIAATPVGKVPALVLDNGGLLTESTIICEYLDQARPSPVLIGADRWDVLGRVGLARGLTDAAFTTVLERRRPADRQWSEWLSRQAAAIARTLTAVRRPLPRRFDLGDIALACALAYLDYRLPETGWRTVRPDLADWLGAALRRPSLAATRP
jgi:glutathione S-transferase